MRWPSRPTATCWKRRRPTVMIVQSAVILTDRVSRQNSRLPLSTWVQSFETPVEEGGWVGDRARQADQWRYDSCRQIGWSEPRGCHDFQCLDLGGALHRSEEHTSELQSLMRISYAVFCL